MFYYILQKNKIKQGHMRIHPTRENDNLNNDNSTR